MFKTQVRHCKRCGRSLAAMESCDCGEVIGVPRDGLRAKCPHFMYRSSYGGRSYIVCNKVGTIKRSYKGREERDSYYRFYCCGRYKDCPLNPDRVR